MTDAQIDRSSGFEDPHNTGLDRGLASFSRAHDFNANYVYDLPFFRSSTRLVKATLGGWCRAALKSWI